MSKMGNTNPPLRSTFQLLVLITCVVCVVVGPSLYSFATAGSWLNNPLVNAHHLIDLDEEILVFAVSALLPIGLLTGRMDSERPIIQVKISSPPLPPPK
jgi:hypothetical protein